MTFGDFESLFGHPNVKWSGIIVQYYIESVTFTHDWHPGSDNFCIASSSLNALFRPRVRALSTEPKYMLMNVMFGVWGLGVDWMVSKKKTGK